MWLQGLYLHILFLVSKCWMIPRHIYPMGNLVPKGNSDDSWSCYPGISSLIPISSALSPRIIWTFSFILPFLSEMMFVDISLDCVVSQRPLCGPLVTLPWTLSLMIPFSRRMIIVLRRALHSIVSDRNGLGILVPLPPVVLMGFTHEANIAMEAGCQNFVSQCCAHRLSLTVTKHLDFCCTFYKADVTSRALSSHFVSRF